MIPPLYCGSSVFAIYLAETYGPALAKRYLQVANDPSARERKPSSETAPPMRPGDKRFLELSDQVLAYLATGEKSAREISQKLKLCKSQVHRLTTALVDRGEITREWGHRHGCPPLYLYQLAQAPSMKMAETA